MRRSVIYLDDFAPKVQDAKQTDVTHQYSVPQRVEMLKLLEMREISRLLTIIAKAFEAHTSGYKEWSKP